MEVIQKVPWYKYFFRNTGIKKNNDDYKKDGNRCSSNGQYRILPS